MIFKNQLLLVLFFVSIKEACSKGKSKKSKSLKNQHYPYQYDIHKSDSLPSDLQITTYLYKNQPKTFTYWSSVENRSLTVIVMTCFATVHWSIFPYSQNNLTLAESLYPIPKHLSSFSYTTKDIDIKHLTSTKGLYLFNVIAKDQNTYIHIYLSTENGGPEALKNSRKNNLKFVKMHKKGLVVVKWDPSLVDPQGTNYCMVVNTEKHYRTMCSAENEIFQKNSPSSWEQKTTYTQNPDSPYPLISCVGRKTHQKIPNIKQGQTYFFDLFAINQQSNLTYLLDSQTQKFNGQDKFIVLRDGQSTFANLRKMDGRVAFRFKVGKKSGELLNIFIMPCGGHVFVEVKLKGNTVVPLKRVDTFKNISISNIVTGNRYTIKITYSHEEYVNTGVMIFATSKSSLKSPIPSMPQDTTVKEFESLRKCDSVTIGWMPSPGQSAATYCLVVIERKYKENEGYSQPNQCGLENRLRKSLDFTMKYCKSIKSENRTVITEQINHLKIGKRYMVLVAVKKPRGIALPYNVLHVYTRGSCQPDLYIK